MEIKLTTTRKRGWLTYCRALSGTKYPQKYHQNGDGKPSTEPSIVFGTDSWTAVEKMNPDILEGAKVCVRMKNLAISQRPARPRSPASA